MALIGLFCANHPDVDGEGEPRALLTVGGVSLLARNLRLAEGAGVERLMVLAERLPPRLAAEIDALRDDHPELEVVRQAEVLATMVEGHDRVLLIDEGVLVDSRLVEAVAQVAADSVVAIWPAGPAIPERAARLDAQHFSAAVGLFPGHLVRHVAKGLGDWDFEQTLIRAAVARPETGFLDVNRIDTYDPAQRAHVPLLWQVVDGRQAAERAGLALSASVETRAGDAPTRFIYAPLAGLVMGWVEGWPVRVVHMAIGGLLLFMSAVASAVFGWPLMGLLLAVCGGFTFELTDRLARIRLEPDRTRALRRHAEPVLEAAWYGALAAFLHEAHGLAPVVLALLLIVVRGSADAHRLYHERLFRMALDEGGRWPALLRLLASGARLNLWLLLPFAVAQSWYAGLWCLAGYALLTYAAVMVVFWRRLTGGRDAVVS